MDAAFPERRELKGVAKFKFDMREVFIAAVPGQVADSRPVVLVTQGTVATDPTDLLLPSGSCRSRH